MTTRSAYSSMYVLFCPAKHTRARTGAHLHASSCTRVWLVGLQLELEADGFMFIRGPSAYFSSAIAMRHVLNRELRLRDWQQGDGFNYFYNRIESLTVFDPTANCLSNYACSSRSVNWAQFFEHKCVAIHMLLTDS